MEGLGQLGQGEPGRGKPSPYPVMVCLWRLGHSGQGEDVGEGAQRGMKGRGVCEVVDEAVTEGFGGHG